MQLSREEGEALRARLEANSLTAEDRRVLGKVLTFYFQQPQNSTLYGLAGFATDDLSPVLFQLLETGPRLMTKTIQCW